MADVHLDFVTGLPFIDDDGTGVSRLLGLIPQSSPMALPQFRAYHKPRPQSEWVDIDVLNTYNPPILDQGQFGSCVGHGGCTAFTLAWLMMGEDLVRFSSCYLYGCINNDRDQGADIGQTIQSLRTRGICLEETVPEGVIYRRDFPPGADAEAANYRLVEAYQTSDPADVATACQMGFSYCDSVMVGRTFTHLDRHGVAGVDKGPGNHAVAGAGMVKLPHGTWAFPHQNSWNTSYGDGGRFLTTEAHMQSQAYYICVVYRAVTPGPNAPPMVA